ncbi:CPBP family intramembrane glutamic endopeptidase [Acetobacterium bakii]|uniref:CAAX prenyl protease 2/Lysostaphin resistance protein A-like domain-containing protein n=1 Tax=Acetobacterium bakii TaxID=52689 RepID=A0A0L6TY87_9FIRM|nr:CPBP family intramembrane glutamic endopeptidase [Acetobacterium bakii]KNZ41226.1 hypothetical protein AKG39_12955 [Acetobacterium bakii]
MNLLFSTRHPLRSAILLGFIPILFATAAGVICVVAGLNETQILITQTLSFGISIILGVLIMKKSKLGYEAFGFRNPDVTKNSSVLFFLPLLVAEILPFMNGLDTSISFLTVILLLLFTVFVGINEELFFRGLIFKVFSAKGVKYAVIASSVIFGIGHAATALSGSDPIYVVILIIFAGLFGLVCAEIVVVTKSIVPVIIWHGLHDFIANITMETISSLGITLLIAQTLILCLYAIYLWRKVEFKKEVRVA